MAEEYTAWARARLEIGYGAGTAPRGALSTDGCFMCAHPVDSPEHALLHCGAHDAARAVWRNEWERARSGPGNAEPVLSDLLGPPQARAAWLACLRFVRSVGDARRPRWHSAEATPHVGRASDLALF